MRQPARRVERASRAAVSPPRQGDGCVTSTLPRAGGGGLLWHGHRVVVRGRAEVVLVTAVAAVHEPVEPAQGRAAAAVLHGERAVGRGRGDAGELVLDGG